MQWIESIQKKYHEASSKVIHVGVNKEGWVDEQINEKQLPKYLFFCCVYFPQPTTSRRWQHCNFCRRPKTATVTRELWPKSSAPCTEWRWCKKCCIMSTTALSLQHSEVINTKEWSWVLWLKKEEEEEEKCSLVTLL